jgi:hypothetical protein
MRTSPLYSIIASFAFSNLAAAQSFTLLPAGVTVRALSRDGQVILTTTGLIPIGGEPVALPPGLTGQDLAEDGSVVFAYQRPADDGAEPLRSVSGGPWVSLGFPTGMTSANVWTCSASGNYAAGSASLGLAPAKAFVWNAPGGYSVIHVDGWDQSWALGMSDDGQVVVGGLRTEGREWAYRWEHGAGPMMLDGPVGTVLSQALSVSGDGRSVFGYYKVPGGTMYPLPCRWIDGGREALPLPSGTWGAWPQASSVDGRVVAGFSLPTISERRACTWTPRWGVLDLQPLLNLYGIDTTGWILNECLDISSDGLTMVGYGTFPFERRGFIVTLPRSVLCHDADVDSDGVVGDSDDIDAFFACLTGNCCPACDQQAADFNGDGDFGTDQDIESFFRVLAGQNC